MNIMCRNLFERGVSGTPKRVNRRLDSILTLTIWSLLLLMRIVFTKISLKFQAAY